VILSGDMDGLVAISNSSNGVVLCMINEHRGIPITDLSVANKPTQVTVVICIHGHVILIVDTKYGYWWIMADC